MVDRPQLFLEKAKWRLRWKTGQNDTSRVNANVSGVSYIAILCLHFQQLRMLLGEMCVGGKIKKDKECLEFPNNYFEHPGS